MNNLIAWSLQIAVLVAVAAFVPALVRMKMPGARLAFWQAVLVACLLMPAVRPWRTTTVKGLITITSRVTGAKPAGYGFHPDSSFLAVILGAGILVRLGWLAMGLVRLRRYRLSSSAFDGESVRISADVMDPVTFGFFQPVIILPAGFPQMDFFQREAILCHERLHVERRDWLFTLAEEVVRAVFWFHPGVWWVSGEIQLAREQVVDRAVTAITGSPDRYVDALLAVAGASNAHGPQVDWAPAPMFLRRRHLKKRVFSLLKEGRMSKARSLSALAMGLGTIAAACWFVTGAIPLKAAPEPQKLRLGGNVAQEKIISRVMPVYPPDAKASRIQGKVELTVEIGTDGKVKSVAVLSGPPELVQSAVDAVNQWVYQTTLLNGEPVEVITTVDVNYTLAP
jgi:TonB family protein